MCLLEKCSFHWGLVLQISSNMNLFTILHSQERNVFVFFNFQFIKSVQNLLVQFVNIIFFFYFAVVPKVNMNKNHFSNLIFIGVTLKHQDCPHQHCPHQHCPQQCCPQITSHTCTAHTCTAHTCTAHASHYFTLSLGLICRTLIVSCNTHASSSEFILQNYTATSL